MLDVIIIILSLVVQCVSLTSAIIIARIADRRWAWIAISIALILMILRSMVSFYGVFTGNPMIFFYQANEVLWFLLSISMMMGIASIVFGDERKLDITGRCLEQDELKREVAFEKLISNIAKNLVEVKSADVEGEIKDALGSVGEFIGFDRANIFLVSEDGKTKSCFHEWKRKGIQSFFQSQQEYLRDYFQKLEHAVESEGFVYVEDVNELGDDWAKEKEQWVAGNVKSNICVSLNAKGKYLGYICFEYVSNARQTYKNSDRHLLKTAGEIIASVLERKKIEEELEKAASFDALTMLPNRYQFDITIDSMLSYSARNKLVLAVLSVDIDNFKDVNDAYGHAVGDKLLIEVGRRFRDSIRAEDFVARLGGDEFIVVIFGLKEPLEAGRIAEKLIDVSKKEYDLEGHPITITTSIGVACYPADGQDKQILLKYADIAMYKAKELGKNSYQFFTKELQIQRQNQLELENELQNALEKKEFFLVYQPQFDENKRVIGMEALLRWRHPIKGLLLPGKYIVFAESIGLIVPLGKWVLEEASKQYREWYVKGVIKDIRMSINLSFRQIERDALSTSKDFFEIIKKSKGVGSNFELELTETALMEKPEKSREILNKLRDGGFDIAIDDFGTGYSSLQYLKYLPVQRIKIDRSFISGIGVNKGDEVIVDAAIALSGKLGFMLIAEGVETKEQFEFLKEHGCKQYQGFYFSRPLEVEDMLALLEKNYEMTR